MTIYLTTCIISMLFIGFLSRFRRKGSKLQFALVVLISALPCILVAGLRYGIGSDYFTYESYFMTGLGTKDPLYFSVLNSLVQFFGGDFAASVFIVSALIFLLTYTRILEDSPYPWLSVFLLFGMTFFFASLNAMRQFLAIAILLYSIKCLERNQNIRFFILVAIASGIHLSSIIFCALYILHKMDLDTRLFVILTPVIFGGIYLLRNNLGMITSAVNAYSNFIVNNATSGGSLIIQGLWQLALILVGGFVYKNSTDRLKQNKFRIYFDTQLLALWEYALVSVINPNEIMRIIWIFAYPGIIFTPMVIRRLPSKLLKIAAISVVVLGFGIFWIYAIGLNNSHEVLPYRSIFDV